jgi:hypothetical protein
MNNLSAPAGQALATEALLAHRIGSRVRERRSQLGLSVADLTAHAGLADGTVIEGVEAETGTSTPVWQLVRIAQALCWTLCDLDLPEMRQPRGCAGDHGGSAARPAGLAGRRPGGSGTTHGGTPPCGLARLSRFDYEFIVFRGRAYRVVTGLASSTIRSGL